MNITIIIKTFQRKNDLQKLLTSINKFYPNLPIIILDDSKKNYSKYIKSKFNNLDIKYIVEDFDIGLSKGRNILINNVKTKYFLLCDDDFEFDERTNLEKALKLFKENDADILGGNVYNHMTLNSLYSVLWLLKDIRRIKNICQKEEICSIYNGNFNIKNNSIELFANKNVKEFQEKKIYKTDICSNFFIANTQKIVEIGGWTPESLKVGEHEFFFLKAKKNKLKVFYTPLFGVKHFPKKTLNYMKFRARAEELFKNACKDLNFSQFIIKDIHSGGVVYSYEKK